MPLLCFYSTLLTTMPMHSTASITSLGFRDDQLSVSIISADVYVFIEV